MRPVLTSASLRKAAECVASIVHGHLTLSHWRKRQHAELTGLVDDRTTVSLNVTESDVGASCRRRPYLASTHRTTLILRRVHLGNLALRPPPSRAITMRQHA